MSIIGKTVLSILLVVAIVSAALWILGGKRSEYSTALSIDAPSAAIFPYLTQPERLKSWTTGLSEVSELLPAPKVDGIASGRVKKTPRVITKPDGSQVRYEDQVIRYEENLSISVQSSNPQQVITYIYQLEPRDGQTFLSYRIKTSSLGVGRLLAPISSNDFQDRIDTDIRKLKTLVESSPHPEATGAPGLPPTNGNSFNSSGQLNSTPDVSVSSFQNSEGSDAGQGFNVTLPDQPTPRTQPPVSKEPIQPSSGRNAETPVSGQPFSF